MQHLYCLAVIPLFVSLASSAYAFDVFNKVAQKRPEAIDLSSTVSSRGGFFSASYKLEGQCPPLNEIHSWDLEFVDREGNPLDGADVAIVVEMPEHLHGMTTKPKISNGSAPGQFRVDGIKFHMPGWWVATLDVSKDRGRDLAYFNFVVGEGICDSK